MERERRIGRRIAERFSETGAYDDNYLGVLDGVRAFSVLLVLWFHLWQQSWWMPSYQTPFLAFLGITELPVYNLRRTGYLWVDMLVLLCVLQALAWLSQAWSSRTGRADFGAGGLAAKVR